MIGEEKPGNRSMSGHLEKDTIYLNPVSVCGGKKSLDRQDVASSQLHFVSSVPMYPSH